MAEPATPRNPHLPRRVLLGSALGSLGLWPLSGRGQQARYQAPGNGSPTLPFRLDMTPHNRELVQSLLDLPQKSGTRRRLEAISAALLGTPYGANGLGGGPGKPEVLTVDLTRVDCLSYLEYVTALTFAQDMQSFLHWLVQIRYFNEIVSWPTRRHFFSDWLHPAPRLADSVSRHLSPDCHFTIKALNRRENGTLWLADVPVFLQQVDWLPVSALTPNVLGELKTGDLLGSYTPQAGLDVTHTGFAIVTEKGVLFRNASSLPAHRCVSDTPLDAYMHMRKRFGLVVLRLRQLTD
ncbi:N-acetylmuramoyl-L-alanine amidase-like domain-containing protein [Oecophyllibacter saccharovorans]|nr:N-acetylmuramoyl-L-alanine amidase-like domain-containing protein [Oecophyllibacter saccharovorans]TPW36349.1 DUF1460 domain-containing protein [Oecophyllibacter saccharovorans]